MDTKGITREEVRLEIESCKARVSALEYVLKVMSCIIRKNQIPGDLKQWADDKFPGLINHFSRMSQLERSKVVGNIRREKRQKERKIEEFEEILRTNKEFFDISINWRIIP